MAVRISSWSLSPEVLPERQRSTARHESPGSWRRAEVGACGGMSIGGCHSLLALLETGLPVIKIQNILLQAEKGLGNLRGGALDTLPKPQP